MATAELVLKELLPANEAKVYLAMLGLGSASATEITERCGLHRASVYDCLEHLHQKGIITVIEKQGKKFFENVSPDRLQAILEEKKRQIGVTEQALTTILPELEKRFESRKSQQLIHHLVGVEGLRTVTEEMLKEGKKTGLLQTINSTGGFRKHLSLYFKKWDQRRLKNGISLQTISPERRRGSTELEKSEVRYLPDEFYTPLTIEILGNKVALMIYEEQPLVVLIESVSVAEAFKKQFEILWKVARA